MDLSKELVAASATPLVLAILQRGDSYGYEIIKSVRDLSGGELEWKEGMLYPLLHRLASQGLIEGYEGVSATQRPRKYYRLLRAGEKRLDSQRQGFDLINSTLRKLQSTNPGVPHVSIDPGVLHVAT
jgi:PadR family transcriptional regulator, regulatory protein PadR